jgi:hypothetical protein
MLCPKCTNQTTRLIIDKHGTGCASCRGLSENGGPSVQGILTRSSERVRAQQHTNEGDMILPHTYDKVTGQVMPNPDFVKLYPNQLPTYFTQEELQNAGYSKANKIYEKKAALEAELEQEQTEVEYATEGADQKIADTVKAL